MNELIAVLVCPGAAAGAIARTHAVWPSQGLVSPDSSYEFFAMATAIDGALPCGKFGMARIARRRPGRTSW